MAKIIYQYLRVQNYFKNFRNSPQATGANAQLARRIRLQIKIFILNEMRRRDATHAREKPKRTRRHPFPNSLRWISSVDPVQRC